MSYRQKIQLNSFVNKLANDTENELLYWNHDNEKPVFDEVFQSG